MTRRSWAQVRLGLVVVAIAAVPARADLAAARQAQAQLGPETWSQVLEIRNAQPGRYPEIVYATVFEFDRVLWFYTGTEGTQSLSLRLGRVEQDRGALEPLLHALHPGFTAFRVLPATAEAVAAAGDGPLPHGCFIDSVCELRRRLAAGEAVADARLLAIYLEVPGVGRVGHTGLLVSAGAEGRFWDPAAPAAERTLAGVPLDPLEAARALVPAGRTVAAARYWTVSPGELARPLFAARSRRSPAAVPGARF